MVIDIYDAKIIIKLNNTLQKPIEFLYVIIGKTNEMGRSSQGLKINMIA
jgi:hypothetical protein